MAGAGDPEPWVDPNTSPGPGWTPQLGRGARGGVECAGCEAPEVGCAGGCGAGRGCLGVQGRSGQVWGPWDRELTGAAAPLPRRKTPGGCPGWERWQRVLLPFSAEEMSRFSRARGGGGRGAPLCATYSPPCRPLLSSSPKPI